jgi:hypothetical protein
MKAFTTAASILLIATVTRGDCVVISPTVPSKQNARAAVTVDGKPAVRLPIHIVITSFANGKQSEMRIATDAHGAIDLKNLPAGQNCITADADPRLTASLCLDVTASHDATPTQVPLVLTALPAEPTLDELAKEHEKSPIELTGPAFVGTVKDQAGAGITKAEITVYRRGALGKPKPLKLQADDQGNFTTVLESGTYTAVVMSPGFKSRFVGVEIKQDAPKQDMSIELKIGNVC